MVIKCKMCGGDLNFVEGSTICECEYCGSKQTLPSADSEKKVNLFNRANRLRMNNEFDKASVVYEAIAAEFPEEAEAYWGLCLCAYGIEYVDDPTTGKKLPTCHRTLATSIMEDSNFEQACDNADSIARKVYREEAKAIDRIQKDILAIAENEAPYDVFICYKEMAEDGSRTEDSVLAQDIYDALTAKGLKVFFSRITLEDKLGVQYEPYIYAALSSARVMLAVGTQFEYYDAVWVKNEWSRFLHMMQADKSKVLIPCFKNLDAYDIPKEFKGLQAQNMDKLGWMQDLVRGVMKLCGKGETPAPVIQKDMVREVIRSSNVENLMKRVYLFLEDGKFEQASEYIDKVLDEDAEYAPAYIGKVLVRHKLRKESALAKLRRPLDNDVDWRKALRFAGEQQKQIYEDYARQIRQHEEDDKEKTRLIQFGRTYDSALSDMNKQNYALAIQKMKTLTAKNYQDSETLLRQCIEAYKNQLMLKMAISERVKLSAEWEAVEKAENWIHLEQKKMEDMEAEAEKEAKREQEIQNEMNSLSEELSQLHGFFSGRRKRELESSIETLKREQMEASHRQKKFKIAAEEARAELKSAGDKLAEAESVLNAAKEELEKENPQWTDDEIIEEAKKEQYIAIGNYPQTADGNDHTPIEWQILEWNGKKALLLSHYGLAVQRYHTQKTGVTWEKCDLRTWMNDTFLKEAFTVKERAAIQTTNVYNDEGRNRGRQGMNGGSITRDKLFLLSYAEADQYLNIKNNKKNDTKLRTAPTAYAVERGAYISSKDQTADDKTAGRWWLRQHSYAELIDADGARRIEDADQSDVCVRPALWVNFEALNS